LQKIINIVILNIVIQLFNILGDWAYSTTKKLSSNLFLKLKVCFLFLHSNFPQSYLKFDISVYCTGQSRHNNIELYPTPLKTELNISISISRDERYVQNIEISIVLPYRSIDSMTFLSRLHREKEKYEKNALLLYLIVLHLICVIRMSSLRISYYSYTILRLFLEFLDYTIFGFNARANGFSQDAKTFVARQHRKLHFSCIENCKFITYESLLTSARIQNK
jgi:hypothetical protein